jgi:hypothetical protein
VNELVSYLVNPPTFEPPELAREFFKRPEDELLADRMPRLVLLHRRATRI